MEANEWIVIAMFGSFILLLFTGIPVAYVLGGIGVVFAAVGYFADIYLDTFTGLDYTSLGLVVNRIYKIMDNWILVALPMFIFMGNMLDKSGIAEKLMSSMQALFGKVHGGLAITVMAIGIILAASTGIIGASVVLLTVMSLPSMMRQGYHLPLALGTVASAGTLGILLPPSIMLVIMADQLGLSVGDLFMGAMGATLLAAYNKKLNLKVLKEVLLSSYGTTAYIFMIFLGASCFALVLRELGGDELIESFLTSLPFGPYGIIAFILLIVFLLGFFLDWIEITLIALPLLAPVISSLGIELDGHGVVDNPSLVWFVMLVAMALQTSFLTPPVGFALFYLKGVCPDGVALKDIYRGVIPFILIQLTALICLVMWPQLVLWFPSVAYG
jgi:TRAP-type mannitol/chloroaromatic compound transport system permease large subunit